MRRDPKDCEQKYKELSKTRMKVVEEEEDEDEDGSSDEESSDGGGLPSPLSLIARKARNPPELRALALSAIEDADEAERLHAGFAQWDGGGEDAALALARKRVRVWRRVIDLLDEIERAG